MEQFFGPENLDFVVKHSWTWYLMGAAFLQLLLIIWAVVVIRRKSAEIKKVNADFETATLRFVEVAGQRDDCNKTVKEKEAIIIDLRQQLANTKQLVMDGVAAYFDKKEDTAAPPATQE